MSSIEPLRLRLLLDQNAPIAVSAFVRTLRPDWTVEHVAGVGLWGAADAAILRWAQHNSAIVVTYDEDFADARMYPAGVHPGVIRLRVWPTTVENTQDALARVLAQVPDGDLAGSLVIVDNRRIRVRRLIRHG